MLRLPPRDPTCLMMRPGHGVKFASVTSSSQASRNTICKARRYLFAAGGTGGHVFPALTVADEIRKLDPDAEIQFWGDKDRIESTLVAKHGYNWESIKTVGMARPMFSFPNVWNFFKLLSSVWSTSTKMKNYKPDVILGTGGFISFPTCLAAFLGKRPFFLHEANVLAGFANRALCWYARGVFTAFKIPDTYLQAKVCRRVGNPVRPQFFETDRDAARKELGVKDDQMLLTVVGGSLGAGGINDHVNAIAPGLLDTFPNLIIHHQTGVQHSTADSTTASDEPTPLETSQPSDSRYSQKPFIDEMAQQMVASDLVIARCGGMTCSELLATGTPSLLIPLPLAADNHQYFNGVSMQAMKAAVLFDEAKSSLMLATVIKDLLKDEDRLDDMSVAAKSEGNPHSAKEIALAMYQTAVQPGRPPEILRQYAPAALGGARKDDDDSEYPTAPGGPASA